MDTSSLQESLAAPGEAPILLNTGEGTGLVLKHWCKTGSRNVIPLHCSGLAEEPPLAAGRAMKVWRQSHIRPDIKESRST